MTRRNDPVVPVLDLHGVFFQTDPHGALREAREQCALAETAMGTAILRYADVHAALAHRGLRTPGADFLFMQGITTGPLVNAMQNFLLSTEGEAHDRVRRLVNKAFTLRRVEEFRPSIRAIASDLVNAMERREDSDFIEAFADPFALRTLLAFIGIPEDAYCRMHQWTSDLGLLFGMSVAEHSARIEAALDNLHDCIDKLLAEKRRTPGPDLVSALIAARDAEDLLTDAELRSLMITLMSAGHDTVRHQIGHAMAAFLAHPEQWRLLGSRPDLSAQAADEVVRWSPASVIGMPRVATADVDLFGRSFARGAFLLPITGSANRDPRVFEAADEFDIHRKRSAHLTFGGGIHFCLGAALARVELQEVLPMLAERLLDPIPAGPADWRPPTEAVYGPERLPIAYRIRRA